MNRFREGHVNIIVTYEDDSEDHSVADIFTATAAKAKALIGSPSEKGEGGISDYFDNGDVPWSAAKLQ